MIPWSFARDIETDISLIHVEYPLNSNNWELLSFSLLFNNLFYTSLFLFLASNLFWHTS